MWSWDDGERKASESEKKVESTANDLYTLEPY